MHWYLAVAFAYVERILEAAGTAGPEMASISLSSLELTIPMLQQAGFADIYEDFYNPLETLLQKIAQPDIYGKLTPEELLETFQDDDCRYRFD